MTTDELAQIEIEMRAAYARRKATREALTAARGELEDRKADHKKACDAVDALVLQLGTGQRQATMPGFSEPTNGERSDWNSRHKFGPKGAIGEAVRAAKEFAGSVPIPPDPAAMITDHLAQCEVERGEPDADLADGKAAWDAGTVDRAAKADARMAASMKHAMEEDVPEGWRAEAPSNGAPQPRKARKARKPQKEAAKS